MLSQEQIIQTNINKGMQLRAQNKKEEALSLANALYKQYPQDEKTIGFFALLMLETDYASQAIKLLEHSIQQLGERYSFYFDLAGIYKATGNKDKSIHFYQEALKHKPDCALSLFLIGQIYMKKDMPEQAIPHLQKSLQINTNNPEAKHLLNIAQGEKIGTASKEYVSKVFDDFADNFEETLVNKLDYKTPEKICSQFKKHTSNELNTIIDLGCGTGLCAPMLAPICKILNGVDLSQKMLDKAAAKDLYKELACADICEYLNKQSNLSAAIAADVFVYIGDLKDIFVSCNKSLNKNGLFSFSVEKTEKESFEALVSGRFAHNINYLKKLAKDTDFEWLEDEESIIRTESGQNISGYLITLKKRG